MSIKAKFYTCVYFLVIIYYSSKFLSNKIANFLLHKIYNCMNCNCINMLMELEPVRSEERACCYGCAEVVIHSFRYLVYHSPQFLLPAPVVFYIWLTSHWLFHLLIPEHRVQRECSCLAENRQKYRVTQQLALYPVSWIGFFLYIII